jgi:four helix bundle protein
MSNYQRLNVWKAAHSLTLSIYSETAQFPRHEQFGLSAQLRRACVSIGANLAEGSSRSRKDFARFLTIALGSTSELEYLLLVSRDLGYIDTYALSAQAVSIARMLQRLRQSMLAGELSARR